MGPFARQGVPCGRGCGERNAAVAVVSAAVHCAVTALPTVVWGIGLGAVGVGRVRRLLLPSYRRRAVTATGAVALTTAAEADDSCGGDRERRCCLVGRRCCGRRAGGCCGCGNGDGYGVRGHCGCCILLRPPDRWSRRPPPAGFVEASWCHRTWCHRTSTRRISIWCGAHRLGACTGGVLRVDGGIAVVRVVARRIVRRGWRCRATGCRMRLVNHRHAGGRTPATRPGIVLGVSLGKSPGRGRYGWHCCRSTPRNCRFQPAGWNPAGRTSPRRSAPTRLPIF